LPSLASTYKIDKQRLLLQIIPKETFAIAYYNPTNYSKRDSGSGLLLKKLLVKRPKYLIASSHKLFQKDLGKDLLEQIILKEV
jgi:hypothetical protein